MKTGRWLKVVPWTVAAMMAVSACGSKDGGSGTAPASGAGGSGTETVKVGVLMPLTGSTAWAGKTLKVAAELARDEINAAGLAGKYKLDLVITDAQCEPRAAHDAAEKLISQDKVKILVGEWCSSASIAAVEVARDHKVPFLVNISSADYIAKNGGPYIFQSSLQNRYIDEREYQLLTQKFKFNSVAIMVENNDFGLTFRKNMLELLKKDNKKVILDLKQDRNDTNFYSSITKIQSEKPDVIVVSLSAGQAANFVKAVAESGLTIPVVSDYTPPPYIFEKQVGAQAAKIGLVRGTAFLNNPDATAKQKDFIAKFEPKASQAAGETHLTHQFDLSSYDGISLIADALKRGGPEADSFAKAMGETKFDGLLGHYEFDADRGAKPEGQPFIYVRNVEGGKLEVVK